MNSSHGNASYTIRVGVEPGDSSTPYTYRLLSGLMQGGNIAASANSTWLYYTIAANPGRESISVRYSTLVGAIEAHVRRCPEQSDMCVINYLPNVTSIPSSAGHSSMEITRNDDTFTFYTIGVLATALPSQFLIGYTMSHLPLKLVADVSVSDYVVKDEYDYYSYYFDRSGESLKIILTSFSGSTLVYVSTTTRRPTAQNSTWSIADLSDKTLTIPPNDAHYCSMCTYYISVTEEFYESAYSITATVHSEGSSLVLVDGQPFSDSTSMLSETSYVYYIDQGATSSDIVINFGISSGYIDGYITLDGSKPSAYNFDYLLVGGGFLYEDIYIRTTDDAFQSYCTGQSCLLKLVVYAWTSSTYTLTISRISSIKTLQIDTPYSSTISADSYQYFKVFLSLPSSLEQYRMKLTTSITSGHVSVYASCRQSLPSQDTSGKMNL